MALKGQFQSLWELWLLIQSNDNLEFVVHWIKCCLILHNMILCFEEQWMTDVMLEKQTMGWVMKEGVEFVDGDDDRFPLDDQSWEIPGQQFQAHLMNHLLEEHHIQI